MAPSPHMANMAAPDASAAALDSFQTTGTFVGKKVGQMHTDLRKLQTAVTALNGRMLPGGACRLL